jgi:tRNA A37 methylthiotransferase MiaB
MISAHLKELIKAILRETDVPRLRLSSLEPWDLDADFFSLWDLPRLRPASCRTCTCLCKADATPR